jgi:UDP-glucose 4-epimerase
VPIDETASPRPISPYGESKLTFEKILRWYDEIYGVKFVCLRYFNAAGATEEFGEDHRPETHLIPTVLNVALGQKPNVEIYGTDYETPDGTCIRDYIHIVDLARAHILALGATASGFYNLGTGGGSSVRQVIATCRKITGRKIDMIEKIRRPGDPARLIASSEKIKNELGWRPQFQSLDAIIESAWKWHQKFPRGYEE